MPVVLEYPDATQIVLADEFALDEESLSTARAAVQLPGRVGQLPADRRFAQPRRLRLSGMFEGLSKEDAELLARAVRGYLVGRGPIKLYRRQGDDRYITVRCVRVADDLLRGRFQGRLYTLSFDLEAADPFWYAATPQILTRAVSAAYDRWTITNAGGVPFQQAKVTFRARSGTVVNPTLHNSQGGYVVAYTGSLAAGESVVLDGEARTAIKGSVNVASAVNAQWHAEGFPLQPGENTLTYQDDPSSSHACDVTIEFTPCWW